MLKALKAIFIWTVLIVIESLSFINHQKVFLNLYNVIKLHSVHSSLFAFSKTFQDDWFVSFTELMDLFTTGRIVRPGRTFKTQFLTTLNIYIRQHKAFVSEYTKAKAT